MTTHNLKRYMMPLFAFFIMFFAAKAENKVLWEHIDPKCTMYCCKFSPDEKYIIHTIGDSSEVVVRDVETGNEIRRSKNLGYFATDLNFSEDGSKIITSTSSPYKLTILDYNTLEVISKFSINDEFLNPTGAISYLRLASFYDNDKSIIAAIEVPMSSTEKVVFVQIDPNNTKNQKLIHFYYGPGYGFAQSPDRKMIAFSRLYSMVRFEIFDVINQKEYYSSEIGGEQSVGWTPSTITWSNDSKYCVSTGVDAIIFDVANKSRYFQFDKANQEKFGLVENYGNIYIPSLNILINSSLSLKAIDIPSMNFKALIDMEDPYVRFWRWLRLNINETIVAAHDGAAVQIYQISDISAVDEHGESDEFTIYPNPSNDFCYIDLNGNTIHNILLASSTGEDLTSSIHYRIISDSKLEINTSALPKGMYFISIAINNNSTLKYKLIKE